MILAASILNSVLLVVSAIMGIVFFWSTLVLVIGLIVPVKRHPRAERKLRFAVLICARNEEKVIRLPVKSVQMSNYPKDRWHVIVLADNCTDATAQRAREAGAEVWEKTTPSSGKGDVLAWGLEKLRARSGEFDAVAVFDADNVASSDWFDAMNDALNDGELVVTGRRMTSNATANVISGWYTVYWNLMNELSNRVRTNLLLSGKLTGTGFAFNLSILGTDGWSTRTMVEDVEFTLQSNIRGRRVAYVPAAEYADEQPVTLRHMWRQLCRWETGCWQVLRFYFKPWIAAMFRRPSFRLFDSYFALFTGMSMAFFVFFSTLTLVCRLCTGEDVAVSFEIFASSIFVVALVSLLTGWGAVCLSSRKRRPTAMAILTFPVFAFILAATALYTVVRPTRVWKPIPHSGE